MGQLSVAPAALAAVFFIGTLAAAPLVRLNLRLYEKLGWRGLAAHWERQLGWWVPAVRGACAVLSVIFLLSALGIR